jgi:excisionase family DNA binding protein
MTVNEAAAALEVHPKTVRSLIASGKLAAYRVGRCVRVTPQAIEEFRRRNATSAPRIEAARPRRAAEVPTSKWGF